VLAVRIRKWRQLIAKWFATGLLLLCAACCLISFLKNKEKESEGSKDWQNPVAAFLNRQMEREFFQIPGYLEEE